MLFAMFISDETLYIRYVYLIKIYFKFKYFISIKEYLSVPVQLKT